MRGILNTECVWCKKKSANKYGEIEYDTPQTIPCAVGKDIRYKQTDGGLIKVEEKYYVLHSERVQDGDTLDGDIVAVGVIRDTRGQVAYYKAVVLNA